MIAFAENLKKVREARGITQAQAAALIGVGRPAFGAWEEGRSSPSLATLVAIVRAFDILDLVKFIADENFDPNYPCGTSRCQKSLLEERYGKAAPKEKHAVNVLLGLVEVPVN